MKNPLIPQTPITIVPPGYQPDLDRLPPRGGSSCMRLVALMLVGLIVLGGMGLGVAAFIRAQSPGMMQSITTLPSQTPGVTPLANYREIAYVPTTPTTRQTATVDSWSATGTALFAATASLTATPSPTVDYCFYLTPSPTPTPTAIYTLDPWQVAGTAVFLQTTTPTPIMSPTPTTPRAWCDLALAQNGAGAATLTPMPMLALVSRTPGPGTPSATPIEPLYIESPTLRAPTARPTTTLFPPIMPPDQPPAVPPAQPPVVPPPVVQPPIVQTVIVVVTQPPLPTNQPPVETVTTQPTALPTATPLPTETLLPTATATDLPSSTPLPTDTPQPTATATSTATATPAPVITIIAGDCLSRYPSFTVANFGGLPEGVDWEIVIEAGAVANGRWGADMIPGAYLNVSAPAWADVPGWYRLIMHQPWDVTTPMQMLDVYCEPPTPLPTITSLPSSTPSATATLTETLTLEPTWTPTEVPQP